MISISATLIVILSICALLFIVQVNEGFANEIGSSYGNFVSEGFANEIGSGGPQVSWPGGVISHPPFSVTGPSGSGYTW